MPSAWSDPSETLFALASEEASKIYFVESTLEKY